MLSQIKSDAETFLRNQVDHAVVTVPAYFNHYQRLATKRAAEIAGLDVLRLINEPTAAAYDHAQEENSVQSGNLLVFDLGGGTLDATVLRVDDGKYTVIATKGNHDLGGLDWDEIIIGRISDAFLREHGKNIRDDKFIMFEVKRKAEELKRALSRKKDVPVFATAGPYRVQFRLTRDEFERDSTALVERCRELVVDVLELAEIEEAEIDEVLLVGGSTRMPMIRDVVQQQFSCKLSLSPHPDEAVARGAALVANREMVVRGLLPSEPRKDRTKIVDVTSHSLGELLATNLDDVVQDGAEPVFTNAIIIPRFTPLPASGENVCLLRHGQRAAKTLVTEGETEDPDDCITLAEFDFDLGRDPEEDDELIHIRV